VRHNENLAWVSRNRAYNPSISGTAVGFEGLDPHGLDVVPTISVNHHEDHVTASGNSDDTEPSLDLAYKLTPSLNASLTINTAFSATEVDDRQVNLTRFGVFFPEKRDFFLREADIFEFGRIGASNNAFGISRPSRENGRPFFSRRVGLSATGQEVDLDYGGKISGRIGRVELGALSIRQGDYDLINPLQPTVALGTIDAQALSVVRAKVGVLPESSVGMIATSGNPSSNVGNSLAGADFYYRNTRLPGGRSLESDMWFEQSDTQGLVGEDTAAGVGFRIPTATGFRGGAAIKTVEKNFRPGLGYLDRSDIRDMTGEIGYTHRPVGHYVQSVFAGITSQQIESLHGGVQSAFTALDVEVTNLTGDVLMFVPRAAREVLLVPFEISPGIVIDPGDYSFGDNGVEIRTGTFRKVVGTLRIIDGDFYDGRKKTQYVDVTWRPSPHFRTNASYEYNEVSLPDGDFETRLVRFGFDIVFSSTLSWVNLVQYDNVSSTAGVNMRLHWIPKAGREVFFVINQNLDDSADGFHTTATDYTAKASYTFRF